MRDYNIRTYSSIVRYEYSLYVLQSRASRSRCSIPGISGRVDMLTSPVPAARAAVATGAWVESKHMYLIHTYVEVSVGAQALFLPIRRRLKKEKEKSVVYRSTWYLVRYMQAPNRLYKSEVRGSVSRVKTPCEQGLPHCTHVLQAEQGLPHARDEKARSSFPMERGPTAKHHPAWNPQCTQWFLSLIHI